MLYAIGEIALVVFGILIALQINNWNQSRQNRQKVDNLLQKIQINIEADINQSNLLLIHYARIDSLLQLVIASQLTTEDYQNVSPYAHQLHNLVISYEQINFKKTGYHWNCIWSLFAIAWAQWDMWLS